MRIGTGQDKRNIMARKPQRKLPAGWEVYTYSHPRRSQRRGVPAWKYVVSAAVLLGLAGIAYYPWQ